MMLVVVSGSGLVKISSVGNKVDDGREKTQQATPVGKCVCRNSLPQEAGTAAGNELLKLPNL